MFREDAASLKPGDILEYTLYLEGLGNGVMQKTYILAVFVRPSTRPDRVVIRPDYLHDTWNRARSVHIDKLALLYRVGETR